MTKKTNLALGLMSGTSADGLTVCLFDVTQKKVVCFKNYPYSKPLQNKILNAVNYTTPKLSELNFELGRMYAAKVKQFLKEFKINAKNIAVIGSHGQTVFHNPSAKIPNTLQIGEGSFLAQEIKVPVVCNFRPADMAAGGSGAPLIPAFDSFLFGQKNPAMLLNIGGISNVALTGKNIKTFGYDIGPGNVMIDAAITLLTNGKKTFDKDGSLSAKYQPDTQKAAELLKLFSTRNTPISLERSVFAEGFISKHFPQIKQEDIATITYLTALIIAFSLKKFILSKYKAKSLIVSGGGVYNKTLMLHLTELLKEVKVTSLSDTGLHPMAKEAAAFAYFAWCTINKIPCSCPQATGAKRKVILGNIILP